MITYLTSEFQRGVFVSLVGAGSLPRRASTLGHRLRKEGKVRSVGIIDATRMQQQAQQHSVREH